MEAQSLQLSSPKNQPFGLLSSKAVVDFEVGVKAFPDPMLRFKHGSWKTVNQFVYINMFKNESHRQRMSEMLGRNQFNNMVSLRQEEDSMIYNASINIGLTKRFLQNKLLLQRLYDTRGKQLIYTDIDILKLLYRLRQDSTVVFDPKTNKDVPMADVQKVIATVTRRILKDPYSVPDNMTYAQLAAKYKLKPVDKPLPPDDDIFININCMVPMIKFRLKEILLQKEIERFKIHLLSVFLDHILKEDYPYLDPLEYDQAKIQQIKKEEKNVVEIYKNQLYDIYVKGDIKGSKIDKILSKLTITPDELLQSMNVDLKELNTRIIQSEPNAQKVYIEANDPFLPHYREDVEIDGKVYNSVTHYAYNMMLNNMLSTGHLPNSTMNLNEVELKDLITVFNKIRRDWIHHNLKANNESAIGMKFEQNPVLIHLLLATEPARLIWSDHSDPILGIGNDTDRKGENITGLLLEFMRVNYKKMVIIDRKISSFSSISDNLWTLGWLKNIGNDLRNTTLLLREPKTSDLEIIYNVSSIIMTPKKEDIETLHNVGLNDEQIRIVFPIIAGIYMPMTTKTQNQLLNDEGVKYFKNTDYYKHDFVVCNENAVKQLGKLADMFQLADGVDKEMFIYSILSGKQTSDKCEIRWERINLWQKKIENICPKIIDYNSDKMTQETPSTGLYPQLDKMIEELTLEKRKVTKKDLLEEAKTLDIKVSTRLRKDEIQALIDLEKKTTKLKVRMADIPKAKISHADIPKAKIMMAPIPMAPIQTAPIQTAPIQTALTKAPVRVSKITKAGGLEGESFKNWKIGNLLGNGAFGAIYELEGHQNLVLKTKRSDLAKNKDSGIFFEKTIYRKISGEDGDKNGIPQLEESGKMPLNNDYYLIMPKFETSLDNLIEKKTLSDFEIKEVMNDVLDALKYLSDRNYLHLDIKTENIMRKDNHWYLIDYGMALKFNSNMEVTKDPKLAFNGTLWYMARDAHVGRMSRKADLESLVYAMMLMFGHQLPWATEKAKNEKKEAYNSRILESKNEFFDSYQQLAIGREFIDFIGYVNDLQPGQNPDYDGIKFKL
jgi:predicted NAD-dependent protein-ADP-ribosyltransferase YbiA (DUF1768 family)